jgi:hypothetical protein
MGKKIIRLTETDLTKIVKKVISEQTTLIDYNGKMADELLRKGPKPTESGAKYCFSRNDLIKELKMSEEYLGLYKIKPDDSIDKLLRKTMLTQPAENIYRMNHLCNLKDKNGFKANDVIMLDYRPTT